MKPELNEQTLFAAARAIGDCEQRAAYLDQACANRPELRQRLDRLLAAEQRADEFFESNPLAPGAGNAPTSQSESTIHAQDRFIQALNAGHAATVRMPLPAEGPGAMLGRYKLLQQIGEGGFGVVYMAEQKEPVKRRVALKIIKLGMDTKQVAARFEAERQALALMDHPNIAKVFDAGMTGGSDTEAKHSNPQSHMRQGRPYFVMELVKGAAISIGS